MNDNNNNETYLTVVCIDICLHAQIFPYLCNTHALFSLNVFNLISIVDVGVLRFSLIVLHFPH